MRSWIWTASCAVSLCLLAGCSVFGSPQCEWDGETLNAACPVTGKTGADHYGRETCPVTARAGECPEAEVCPVTGESGECPASAGDLTGTDQDEEPESGEPEYHVPPVIAGAGR